MINVAFVCLGNICRSPMAEAVFRKTVEDAGLASEFHIDSFATSTYNDGCWSDSRSAQTCKKHGVPVKHRSQHIEPHHFDKFDYILCMDRSNLSNLLQMSPPQHKKKIELLGEYRLSDKYDKIIKDPYYSGDNAFEHNFQQIADCSAGLLKAISEKHDL